MCNAVSTAMQASCTPQACCAALPLLLQAVTQQPRLGHSSQPQNPASQHHPTPASPAATLLLMDQATGAAPEYQEVLAALAQLAGLARLALHWRPANLRGLGAASWGASGASSDVLWQGLAQGLHLVGRWCWACMFWVLLLLMPASVLGLSVPGARASPRALHWWVAGAGAAAGGACCVVCMSWLLRPF
jgi:hypothetical protein